MAKKQQASAPKIKSQTVQATNLLVLQRWNSHFECRGRSRQILGCPPPWSSKLALLARFCHCRQDPEIESILAAPGQCALYSLDVHLKQWSRLDVEVRSRP